MALQGMFQAHRNLSQILKNLSRKRLMPKAPTSAGSFKAIANGDPTCLESFQKPQMHLFSGQLTVLVQSGCEAGDIIVEVSAKGVKKASLKISVE